jgi:hypothetical protein
MSIINDLIMKKLDGLPQDVLELAVEAIKASESGMPEVSIVELLEGVVRKIVRKKEIVK